MSTAEKVASLADTAPFDRLQQAELGQVLDTVSPRHFTAGQTILQRWENPAYLYLVLEGSVEERDNEGVVAHYSRGDSFDSKALIEGRTHHHFVAQKSCHCALIPARLFLALTRTNRAFHDFYYQDLSRRLDALVALQQQREAASFMMARIGMDKLHPPVFVTADTSIHDAVALMKEQRVTALLVKQDQRMGIFTSRDLREKSVLMGMADSTPIGDIASYDLITLDADDFLFNALVAMTRHAIRHLVITHGGQILGTLEQIDLLSYLSSHSYYIANQIERSSSEDELKEAGEHIPQLIQSLDERGVRARHMARLVTDLNRKIFRRLYERIIPPALQPRTCLIVMGSEGRGEQLLRTDQDNALIFQDEETCRSLEPHAKAFTQALIELGFPPCPGQVMTSNPAWAKPMQAFKQDVFTWIHDPDEDAFMNLAIFYDAIAVAGDDTLLGEVKTYLLQLLHDQPMVLRHFARATLSFPTPLGLFNRLRLEKTPAHAGELDIKKGGLFPIVHGVRSLALEQSLTETNTIARIQALSGRGPFDERFTADLIEAFDFMAMLRLRAQLAQSRQGLPINNYVNPGRLNKLERGLLRDSLKIVKEFKAFINTHFKLDTVS